MNRFDQKLSEHGQSLRRGRVETLQINVGRKCNQACRHCHVDAGPWRTETISAEVAERVCDWITRFRPAVVDITGGAPELSDHFRGLVIASRGAGCRVIDRNNLTILEEPGFEDLAEFLAEHEVEIIASLPCYQPGNVARQRGAGVFERSIRGLQKLKQVGYGEHLSLHLVYNPVGPVLPPPQAELELDYREALLRDHGIRFTGLYTITNQPLARFADDLRERGEWDSYLDLLANSFNPSTIEGLMCRSTISVGYSGEIFDCDFNQMLNMQRRDGAPLFLWDITPDSLIEAPVMTGVHCLACSAGAGSSCGGAVV